MEQKKITVIFTCFNRKEKTLACIRSLRTGNEGLAFSFLAVDDGSTDGTTEALERLSSEGVRITTLHGTGNLYWAGGMRMGIAYAKEHAAEEPQDFYLLVNDDVVFDEGSISRLVREAKERERTDGAPAAFVGAMRDADGNFSYGGIRYRQGIHYKEVRPTDLDRRCDSFNMNCLLLPAAIFLEMPNFDTHYVHSLADFDYGLEMKRRGIRMYVAADYAGVCPDNDPTGGWTDRNLPRLERLKKKENVKGAPFGPWFYFLKKNFGWRAALFHAFTPYLRILLGK